MEGEYFIDEECTQDTIFGYPSDLPVKTFKRLNRGERGILKELIYAIVPLYWERDRQIPVDDVYAKLKAEVIRYFSMECSVALKDETMFKNYLQTQMISCLNKLLKMENKKKSL